MNLNEFIKDQDLKYGVDVYDINYFFLIEDEDGEEITEVNQKPIGIIDVKNLFGDPKSKFVHQWEFLKTSRGYKNVVEVLVDDMNYERNKLEMEDER